MGPTWMIEVVRYSLKAVVDRVGRAEADSGNVARERAIAQEAAPSFLSPEWGRCRNNKRRREVAMISHPNSTHLLFPSLVKLWDESRTRHKCGFGSENGSSE